MAVEGKDERRSPVRTGILNGRPNDGLMPHMNPIEGSYGHRRFGKRRRYVLKAFVQNHQCITFTGCSLLSSIRPTPMKFPSASSSAQSSFGDTGGIRPRSERGMAWP